MSKEPHSNASAVSADYVRLMARYNRWMNEKIFSLCADLPDAERKKDRHAFFGSIHGTLNHLLYGDLAWLGRFVDGAPRSPDPRKIIHERFEDMRAARAALDQEIESWAGGLTDAWLAATFRYRSFIDGRDREFAAWILVVHMFNHQTHHRGQLTTLLTQMGHDVGSTDIPFMLSPG